MELLALVLALPPSARTSERDVQTTTKPGRPARAATGGKRWRNALFEGKANEPVPLRVTRT